MKFVVIRDTREKENKGWEWQPSSFCAGTVNRKLDTGDYSLDGYEGVLAVERKGSVAEWCHNVFEKRFEAELERLSLFRYPFILLEFNMSDVMRFPVGSGIPRKLWNKLRISGPLLLRKTIEIPVKYNINVLFVSKYGKDVATSIFKRVVECQN